MKSFSYFFLSFAYLFYGFSLSAEARTEKIIKDFETYATSQRSAWNVQGMAIAIVKDDQILLLKGYGQRGISDTQPVDEKTLFQIGSLSKAFTAALVAISVDKGMLKWEDKVLAHMPSFHLADPWASCEFQVVDLLAQRSGLPPHAGDAQSLLGYTQEDMLQHLRFLKPQTSFRSTFAYQNILFVVAANLLERKTGLNYAQLVRKEIFEPLEMLETTATLGDYLANPNRAQWLVHLKNGSIFHLQDHFAEANWSYVLAPAGGINSNIKEMANWMILQANQGLFKGKQLISKANMRRMIRPMIYMGEIEQQESYYALGWALLDYSPFPIIWHNGATLGVYNFAAFIPQEKLGIVILTNGRNTNLATALALQFFDMYFKKPDQDWSQKLLTQAQEQSLVLIEKPANLYPPQPLSHYAGHYHHPIYEDVQVQEENQTLILTIGKKPVHLTLKPWDRDIFTLHWPLMDIDAQPSKVLFISNAQGEISKMDIELLSQEGTGDFEKIAEKISL